MTPHETRADSRWRNGRSFPVIIGVTVLSIGVLFSILSGVPWATLRNIEQLDHEVKQLRDRLDKVEQILASIPVKFDLMREVSKSEHRLFEESIVRLTRMMERLLHYKSQRRSWVFPRHPPQADDYDTDEPRGGP
jgi:hypothetical protein